MSNVANKVCYQFLEHQDTRVNYSFMVEKEACKKEENGVKYLHLEHSKEK